MTSRTSSFAPLWSLQSTLSCAGLIALITGASRGIGRAIALEFARQNLQCLILVSRNTERLAEVAAEVETLGAQAVVLPLDLTQPIEVNVAVVHAWRNFGPIDLSSRAITEFEVHKGETVSSWLGDFWKRIYPS